MADATAPEPEVTNDTTASRTSLGELAAFFLRLGLTAFGGPAAHIAILEDELVRRRRWLSRESFLDLLGASSLIPGPSSNELAIHIGYFAGRMDRAACGGLVLHLASSDYCRGARVALRPIRRASGGFGDSVRREAGCDCRCVAGRSGGSGAQR